jgi:histidinol phosphatase-like PHP family hydrolase
MMGKYSKPTFANENLDFIKIIQNSQNRYQVLQMILTFANEHGKVLKITANQCKEKFKLSKNHLGYTK